MKKLLSLFCTLAILAGVMPMSIASAEETTAKTPFYAVSGNLYVSGNNDIMNVFAGTDGILPRFSERNERASYTYLDGSNQSSIDTACIMKQRMGNLWGDGSQGNYVAGDTQITLWDLGDVYQIDRVDALTTHDSALETMNVSVSADGTSYTDYNNFVSAKSPVVASENVYINSVKLDAPVKARYVRLDARMAADSSKLMSNVVIWSGLQRISEFWNTYHSAKNLLNQGSYTEETAAALSSALDDGKTAVESDSLLTDEIVEAKINAILTALRALVKEENTLTAMHLLSGNQLSEAALNIYKNILGESVTINSTGAQYSVVAGKAAASEGAIQSGDLTNFDAKPWFEAHSATVLYDLKDTYDINRIDIWGREQYVDYLYYKGVENVKVEVSEDNENFTEVAAKLNRVHNLAGQILYMTASFDYQKAQYVKVTVSNPQSPWAWPGANILVMTGSDKTEYKNTVVKANELLESGNYTDESMDALDAALTAAEEAIAADNSQNVIDAQIEIIKNKIIALDYSDAYCANNVKSAVSGNNFTNAAGLYDISFYKNKLGYKLLDGMTGASYRWLTSDNGTDSNNTKLQQTGLMSMGDGSALTNNGWAQGMTVTIQYDLKDTYSINEVDIFTGSDNGYQGYAKAKIEVSSDDADDTKEGVEKVWTTAAELEFDNKHVAGFGRQVLQQVKFAAVDAKYVRVSLYGGNYFQTVLSGIAILTDENVGLRQWYQYVAEIEAMTTDTKYTEATRKNLASVLESAKAAVEADSTVMAQQKAEIEKAVNSLAYDESAWQKKTVVSANVFNGDDINFFRNNLGYDLTVFDTGATLAWSQDTPAEAGPAENIRKGANIWDVYNGSQAWQNKQGAVWELDWDLKDVYSIEEVDIMSRVASPQMGYSNIKIETSVDNETWNTAADLTYDNKLYKNGNQQSFQQIKFAKTDARYVKMTFENKNTIQFALRSITILAGDDVVYNNTLNKARELLANTSVYTAESLAQLSAAIDEAVAAVEADGSSAVKDEQVKKLNIAINNVFFKPSKTKVIVSGNTFSPDDTQKYKDWFGYRTQIAGNNAFYTYDDQNSETNSSDTENNGQELKASGIGGSDGLHNSNTAYDYERNTEAITYDLNGTYEINEIHFYTSKNAFYNGYKELKVEYLPADSDDWVEITTASFDNKLYRNEERLCLHDITFDEVSARKVRLTVNYPGYAQVVFNAIVILGDVSASPVSVTKVVYGDDDGDISSLEGINALYVEPIVYNETEQTIEGLKAVSAIYRDGKLVNVSMSEEFSLGAKASKSLSIEFAELSGMTGSETVKTFIWQGMTPMTAGAEQF